MKNRLVRFLCGVFLLLIWQYGCCAPDEKLLGKDDHYPYPRNKQAYSTSDYYKVGEFSHMEEIFDSKRVTRGNVTIPLPPFEALVGITYRHQGKTYTVDDFLDRQRVTGLLILKDGKVVVERYQYDRTPEMHLTSHSMAKSIAGLLIGIAYKDGKISSLDDTVDRYVPKLGDSPYGKVTIRNLLRMSSGIKWDQVYEPGSDNFRLNAETILHKGNGGVSAISWVRGRVAPQGTRFNYSGGDTYVLGLVLQATIGKPLAEYTSEKLWAHIGAEDDASWLVDWSGTVPLNCCFNARLRDYGRLGMMLANDGNVNGVQVINKEYLLDATTADRQPDYLKPGVAVPWGGYGYQFWIRPNKLRTFGMHGAYGQILVVQPATKIVVVMTSVWQDAENAPTTERGDFIAAVLRTLGGQSSSGRSGDGNN